MDLQPDDYNPVTCHRIEQSCLSNYAHQNKKKKDFLMMSP